jgi:diguanylate cyclase (GGDEF)-like protein
MSQRAEELAPDKLLEIIQAQSEIAALGVDLGSIIQYAAETAQRMTSADGAVIEFAEVDEMVYRAACGLARLQLGLRLKRDGSLSGLCVEKNVPLICDDSETDSRVDREACRLIGLRSMIVVPLRHRDSVVGVLKVLSKNSSAFRESEVRLLSLMSDLIASAMYNATQMHADSLFWRATHDPLTGLANRALFHERLRNELNVAARSATKVGIVNIDMDLLKSINDLLGHGAGDAAIIETARRLQAGIRQSDTVARTGGDEFAILLPSLPSEEEFIRVLNRLFSLMQEPFVHGGSTIALSMSMGTALYPSDASTPEELLDRADTAMYRNKTRRKIEAASHDAH